MFSKAIYPKLPNLYFICKQQEPTDNSVEIYNAIKHVRPGNGFIPKFLLSKLIEVNGKKENEIYSFLKVSFIFVNLILSIWLKWNFFLKRSCISTRTQFDSNEYLLYSPKNARDIRWNFEKFLIHPHTGQPWKRYDQHFKPAGLLADIEHLIAESKKRL